MVALSSMGNLLFSQRSNNFGTLFGSLRSLLCHRRVGGAEGLHSSWGVFLFPGLHMSSTLVWMSAVQNYPTIMFVSSKADRWIDVWQTCDCLVGDGCGFLAGHKCEKTSTQSGCIYSSTISRLHHGNAQKIARWKSRGRKGISPIWRSCRNCILSNTKWMN